MKYLGGFIGSQSGKMHSESRISSCRKSYFAIQGAGLTQDGLSLDAAMYAWSSICNSALLYGCNAIYLNKSQICNIDKIQSNLIKCIVGLKPKHKTTSLLQALKVPKVSVQIDVNNLNLLNTVMKHNSAARDFYLYLLHNPTDCKDILTHRAFVTNNRDKENMSLLRLLLKSY